jgi:ACS family hexuronate transporter-like MFS transporter
VPLKWHRRRAVGDQLDPRDSIQLDYGTTRPPTRGIPGLRWWICALLFLATTINYMDRQVIGVLKPTLQKDLGWNEIDFSNIVFWFQVAYAAGYLFAGRCMDAAGLRIGYTLAIIMWSVAAMSHAFARTVMQFGMARFGLGLAEGGNFPAAIKTVSEWFPAKERALATGLFNAGCNVGVILTPLFVPWITTHLGWPAAFLVTGSLGLIGAVAWMVIYRPPQSHPNLSGTELAHIRSDPPDPAVHISWLQLLEYRATWAFAVGMLMSAPIWWFYLYWIPGFLYDKHGLNLLQMGPPLVTIYLISDFGSIAGGWLSSSLIKRGWSVNAARKTALLICALCVTPVFFASRASGVWTATLLIALAAAAHQGWSANLFTLVSDTMPRRTVSTVVGIGGFAGAVAGMFFAKFIGYVLQWTGSYLAIFAIAAFAYLLALLIMQLILPRVEQSGPTAALTSSPGTPGED